MTTVVIEVKVNGIYRVTDGDTELGFIMIPNDMTEYCFFTHCRVYSVPLMCSIMFEVNKLNELLKSPTYLN